MPWSFPMALELFEQSDQYRAYFDILPTDKNKAYVKIYATDKNQYERVIACLNTSFSFKDPSAANSWEFKHGLYDGMIRLFEKRNNTIDLGMLFRACQMLHIGVPEIKIECSPDVWTVMKRPGGYVSRQTIVDYVNGLKLHNTVDDFDIVPYEHQWKLLERGINGRRISMVACTGAGKSMAQYAMARWFTEKENAKTLIIVPSAGLVEQMYSDFKNDYGWSEIDKHCTLIYADSKDKLTEKDKRELRENEQGEETKLKDVVISTWQSLLKKDIQFFAVFGAVIVDEAHGAKADELRRIVNQCLNASWKMGVSGTIPDDGLDAALIEGSLGRREEIVRSRELIENGILTPVEIHSLILNYNLDVRPYVCRQDYKDECSLFSSNGSRPKIFDVMVSSGHINPDQNSLILFRRKESIEQMKQFIETNYPQFKVYVIIGDVKATIREQYRKAIDNKNGHIVLATYGTMKQGVNIKLLHNLMFAEFSKSMYEIIQSIGRILRKHKLKLVAKVYDIVDNCSYVTRRGMGSLNENYAVKHYKNRLSYYNAEKFPVLEFTLPFEGEIDPTDLDKKREATKQKAAKTPKKPVAKVAGKGNASKFRHKF